MLAPDSRDLVVGCKLPAPGLGARFLDCPALIFGQLESGPALLDHPEQDLGGVLPAIFGSSFDHLQRTLEPGIHIVLSKPTALDGKS